MNVCVVWGYGMVAVSVCVRLGEAGYSCSLLNICPRVITVLLCARREHYRSYAEHDVWYADYRGLGLQERFSARTRLDYMPKMDNFI